MWTEKINQDAKFKNSHAMIQYLEGSPTEEALGDSKSLPQAPEDAGLRHQLIVTPIQAEGHQQSL